MDEINEDFHFGPINLEGFGDETLSIGFADTYMGMGSMAAEILSYKKVSFLIGSRHYEGIIARLKTAYGIISVFFHTDEEENLSKASYVLLNCDMKADLSCGDHDYYTTVYEA